MTPRCILCIKLMQTIPEISLRGKKVLQIKVLDHITIGDNKYFSFADAGLIEKYEDDFLNLRLRKKLVIAKDYN